LVTSLGSGDQGCTFIWRDKTAIDDGDRTERQLNDLIFNENIKKQLAPHFFGELWTFSTRAFLDFSNEPSVFDKLATYMHHSGVSIGMRLIEKYGAFADDDTLLSYIESLWLMHHPSSGFTRSPSALECTVEDCPFSSSPPEICLQYQAFFNGLLEALDSSYEFAYDRMMTKGDKTCHWTIRKKGESEKAKDDVATDDPAKILAIRYAKGEISKKELQERMNNLKELGLVR
jgi:hypothetical protein